MTLQIRIAGFGGQGVMVVGQMLAWCATNDGLNAIFVQHMVQKQEAEPPIVVTISDDNIYQYLSTPIILLFNEPSLINLDKYQRWQSHFITQH